MPEVRAMSALMRRALDLWVRPEVRPETAPSSIDAVQASPVCYVLERRSAVDLAALENLCRRHGLPRPSGRILGRKQSAVRAAIPLLRARGVFDPRIDRRPPADLVRLIEALERDPSLDVRLVPIAVYWGRAPQKEGAWWRLLFAENWALTSGLRKLMQVIINGRFTMIEVGEPTSLRSLMIAGANASTQAARIARAQRATFRKQRAARIGPDLSIVGRSSRACCRPAPCAQRWPPRCATRSCRDAARCSSPRAISRRSQPTTPTSLLRSWRVSSVGCGTACTTA